ncbi:hypothetical protein C4K24_5946 [Pseudomonas chlororaphis subsp. aurantiaca]|nr:hypothetical protein C4K24_5946 [Pseudomonas chlororaphis subsp. aurantiaca]AZE01936.1 hypothetical protein C4K12_6114 [Pseudomonas chlororaphis subsp. aureofaciens]
MLTGAAAAGCDKARRAFLGPQEQRLLRSRSQPAAAATGAVAQGFMR